MSNTQQEPIKGQLVYVKDSEEELWDMRYFSHKKDNVYYCFNNQQTIGSAKDWKYCETENPLITTRAEIAQVPSVEDKTPSAEEYFKDAFAKGKATTHAEYIILMESYSQLARDYERTKWDSAIKTIECCISNCELELKKPQKDISCESMKIAYEAILSMLNQMYMESNNRLPTARQFLSDRRWESNDDTVKIMHEYAVLFARHHVANAIESIKENASIGKKIIPQYQKGVEDLIVYYINPKSIENAYHIDEKIK